MFNRCFTIALVALGLSCCLCQSAYALQKEKYLPVGLTEDQDPVYLESFLRTTAARDVLKYYYAGQELEEKLKDYEQYAYNTSEQEARSLLEVVDKPIPMNAPPILEYQIKKLREARNYRISFQDEYTPIEHVKEIIVTLMQEEEVLRAYLLGIPETERKDAEKKVMDTTSRLLIEAADTNDQSLAKFLIKKGADINASPWKGRHTALSHAIGRGHREMVKLLIENGAEIDKADAFGNTPLLVAIRQGGNQDMVELVINKGANLERVDHEYHRTALLWAVVNNYPEIVQLLIENGANVNAVDSDGETALKNAEERGHSNIVDLLKIAGATE